MQALIVRRVKDYDIEGLTRIVGAPAIRHLRSLARKLRDDFDGGTEGPVVWHINSSAAGGGVADILNCLVPLSTEIGIPSKWLVIGGDQPFFQITKAFHNALQGSSSDQIPQEMLAHYHSITKANAEMLGRLLEKQKMPAPGVIVLHDPQPAALVPFFRNEFPQSVLIWRGHIQFELAASEPAHPGHRVWQTLLPYVNRCDAAVFHLPEMVPPNIEIPVRFILPSIDPLAFINRDLTSQAGIEFIHSTLRKYRIEKLYDPSFPLIIQNGRFDPWKDPQGVIRAFREARESLPGTRKLPQLILLGPLAGDDPQAREVLSQLAQLLNGDGAVQIIPLNPAVKDLTPQQSKALVKLGLNPSQLGAEDLMELEINAFQTRADIIIAKSLREGFGLAVTGAGYHGKPRIVSQVGGLVAQVANGDGKHFAALVGGNPVFSRDASIRMTRDWIVKLLNSPKLQKTMGSKAKQHVIKNFLPHRHLADYLRLFLEMRSLKTAAPLRTLSPSISRLGQPGPAT